ncbi:MAG TPA: hypothetical protein VFB17_07230 [Gaiellaceae bacterium]|nr:hypothetical protein [Gaiellaceae bacterium]
MPSRHRPALLLGALVGFQTLLPLFVLARSSRHALPGLPLYRYDPRDGDAYGYYSALRELLSTWQRDGRLLIPLACVAALVLVIAWRRSRSTVARILIVAWACGLVSAVLVERIRFTGAPQIGWPLVWSVPLLPYRAVGLPLDPNVAFGFGLAISLLANAVTVVMTYALGRLSSRRQGVALGAATLVALGPLLMLLDPRHQSYRNGTWQILLGLALYTEPLSTALVLSALVLVLRGGGWTADAAIGGALLGLAALVRVSNGLIAACLVLALVWRRDRSRALAVVVGGLAFLPALVVFWPKGYPMLQPPVYPAHPFEFAYARDAWSDSLLWHPSVLAALVPVALVGLFAVRRTVGLVLAGTAAATAVLYTFYALTPMHPRFLFVLVPPVMVLWAAGAAAIASRAGALYHRPR